jgi:WD40 repeat protein
VQVWNPLTGQPVGVPIPADTGPGGGVHGVAFSPSGGLLATADADGTVRLWNPLSGQPVGVPIPADTGHRGGVLGVAFSPSGGLLASADGDGTVQLWHVSLFAHPYTTLCAADGPPTRRDWSRYAHGEPEPRICA